jgi:hypothetical protein
MHSVQCRLLLRRFGHWDLAREDEIGAHATRLGVLRTIHAAVDAGQLRAKAHPSPGGRDCEAGQRLEFYDSV